MKIWDKAGWTVGILILLLGVGLAFSNKSTYYDQITITPEVEAVYDWVPTTPIRMIGEITSVMAFFGLVAITVSILTRSLVKAAEGDC